MAGAIDTYALEKQVGAQAVSKLRAAFKSAIRSAVKVSGDSRKATVTSRYKRQRLDRITFFAPHYILKQNYGFEGKKSNGIMMRLQATEVLSKAIESSNVLETLADDISNIRAEEVITRINFLKDGR